MGFWRPRDSLDETKILGVIQINGLIWLVVLEHGFYDFPYIGNNHPN
jgi:hypothetical protein